MASIEDRGKSAKLRWKARYRTTEGATRSRAFARLVDAEDYLATVEADKVRGEFADPLLGRRTFEEYALEWLEGKGNVRPRTRINVEGRLHKHAIPAFGATPIGNIRPAQVRSWVTGLSASGLAPSTIKAIYLTFGQVMRTAEIDRVIPRTPCIGIELPADIGPDREQHYLTPEEIAGLAEAITPRFAPLILAAGYTGLRAGELGALTSDRVNLLRRTIDVAASMSEVRGEVVIGPTKTGKRRTVTLPPFLAELLGQHIGRYPSDEGYVFTSSEGGPLRHRNFMRRHFKAAVAAAELPDTLRFHDLRHSHAAMLIAQGAHPKQVQERLGHSTIRVTFDRYGHLFDGHDDDLLEGLDGLARSASENPLVSYACPGASDPVPLARAEAP